MHLMLKKSIHNRETVAGYLFIAPVYLAFILFMLYPLVKAIIMSFTMVGTDYVGWVGFQNYVTVFKDYAWWPSVKNTIIYSAVVVPGAIFIPFILAALIRVMKPAAQTFSKSCLYLPQVSSGLVMSLVWFWIYDPFNGLLNYLIGKVGIQPQIWLGDVKTALLSLILMAVLAGHGSNTILYIAAMGGIPKTLYEVARLEGANWWQTVRNITWPLLRPTVLYVLIMSIIGSFQVFTPAYVMTRGGPGLATSTVVYKIFNDLFTYFSFGTATAEALILALVIITISLIQFRFFATDVEY